MKFDIWPDGPTWLEEYITFTLKDSSAICTVTYWYIYVTDKKIELMKMCCRLAALRIMWRNTARCKPAKNTALNLVSIVNTDHSGHVLVFRFWITVVTRFLMGLYEELNQINKCHLYLIILLSKFILNQNKGLNTALLGKFLFCFVFIRFFFCGGSVPLRFRTNRRFLIILPIFTKLYLSSFRVNMKPTGEKKLLS